LNNRILTTTFLLIALGRGPLRAVEDERTAHKDAGPATVANRVQETDLTTIRLTEQAETRLAIETVPVEVSDVCRTRTYPGDVTIPPGQVVLIEAPVAGVVTLPLGRATSPRSGMSVAPAEAVLELLPGAAGDGDMIAASDRISLSRARADVLAARADAEGQVQEAQVRVNAAKIKLERADTLRQENAGSQRNYDEAVAEHELAQASQAAAKVRLAALERVLKDLEAGNHSGVPMSAPFAGLIRKVLVAPGQVVPAGAALFEVVAIDPVWIRVPVYVGDFHELDTEGKAEVRGLADRPGPVGLTASRVYPPGSAVPSAATIELFYELENPAAEFRPGQRLGVVLRTRERLDERVVPRAAILYDIYGGTWVYESAAPQTYVRRRVEVRDVIGDLAVLSRGPATGTHVVTSGAAELFGTEFGAGK